MIRDITFHLPSRELDNEELAQDLGRWTPEQIFAKTGIRVRRIAAENETAVDLAAIALEQLFSRQVRSEVDFLILCTQSADYKLPSSSFLLQSRAALPKHCGCLDINLACSGYVYGLMLADSLLKSGRARKLVLVNSDTYSKYIHRDDFNCRPLFGDGAACTLLDQDCPVRIDGFAFGSDGDQALKMHVPAGGARAPSVRSSNREAATPDDPEYLHMDGPEMYNFTLRAIPGVVQQSLERSKLQMKDIDYFVFHQANGFMLESLRRKLNIERERFPVEMSDTGNLVSASIPVVLARMRADGRLRAGTKTLLCGFGVGLSWAACIVTW